MKLQINYFFPIFAVILKDICGPVVVKNYLVFVKYPGKPLSEGGV
jgi:hypothetical protein